MASEPKIAVIVPAHRAAGTIGACLSGLLEQTLDRDLYEVHVVDTGEDRTRAIVEGQAASWDGRLRYHHATGRGPGRQRNEGAERAEAEYLAFTDADCAPAPTWLEAGLERLSQGAAIVQGPTLTPDGAPPPAFSHAIYVPGTSPLYESCNIMYEALAFRDAGGFSVDLFDRTGSHMGEDTELAWRVRRAGGTAVFEPRALVRHAVHPPDFSRHLRYQWQARFFPRLVGRVPELRQELLTAGVFLGPRSLRTSGALAALPLGRRRFVAGAFAAPYLVRIGGIVRRAPTPRAAGIGVAKHLISDVVREAALIWGSLRYRCFVL